MKAKLTILRKEHKGRASSASAGFAGGVRVALLQVSTCAARAWAQPLELGLECTNKFSSLRGLLRLFCRVALRTGDELRDLFLLRRRGADFGCWPHSKASLRTFVSDEGSLLVHSFDPGNRPAHRKENCKTAAFRRCLCFLCPPGAFVLGISKLLRTEPLFDELRWFCRSHRHCGGL